MKEEAESAADAGNPIVEANSIRYHVRLLLIRPAKEDASLDYERNQIHEAIESPPTRGGCRAKCQLGEDHEGASGGRQKQSADQGDRSTADDQMAQLKLEGTRKFSGTVAARIKSDQGFRQALLEEAEILRMNGEHRAASLIAREITDASAD